MAKFSVGILGSGEVAKALAFGCLKHGYPVMVGSRDPAKLEPWQQDNPNAKTGTFAAAAQFGEVLILAVKGLNAAEALELAAAKNFKGKCIIDATNPIQTNTPPKDGVLEYFTDHQESLLEKLQKQFPEANFVKAFNSIGSPFMVNPDFKGGPPTMFYCGDSAQAKAQTAALLKDFGWELADMGGRRSARAIETLCILWCMRGFKDNEWHHAFKLLT